MTLSKKVGPAGRAAVLAMLAVGVGACSSNTASPDAAAVTPVDSGSVTDTGSTFVDAGTTPVDVPATDTGVTDTGHLFQDLPPPPSCISMTALQIVFTPMYSAYDGTHRFQIPAIVNGIDLSIIQWESSDTSIASVAPDVVSGGTMITVHASGTATITAHAGNLCGTSVLTVDTATPDDWEAGNQRYNNGVHYVRPGRGDAGPPDGSSSQDPACTNCHGPTATGPYTDVAHTPEQIGGFSDTVLESLIRQGVVPDGGYFDPAIVPYAQWHSFHQWTMTDDELHGVIVYLRSLAPTPQTGMSNFGGRGDAGMFRRDAGPPVD